MSSAFNVTTPASYEPISLSEAKLYLRVDFDEDDTLINRLIHAARLEAEHVMHRSLATQTITCIETIERPVGGVLSGPIEHGPNWYQYQEQLGANPFGPAQFYFDLPMPPCQSVTTIETRTTVWENWTTFTGVTTLDAVPEPARLYFMTPVTANQWRFTYQAGYNLTTRLIPEDYRRILLMMIAYWYDHREGDELPEGILCELYSRRVDWI